MTVSDQLTSKLVLPDSLYRLAIRRKLKERLKREYHKKLEKGIGFYALKLNQQPITTHVDNANAQHYEVPTEFFDCVLGPHYKYSCAYWDERTDSLAAAEKAMLELTCKRADIQDGQDILELGCGWGSLTLFMAMQYPNSRITAVSNSRTQREHIVGQATLRGLQNIVVITQDVGRLELDSQYDRVVSVEMLEHVRNYGALFRKISSWLKRDGVFFAHVFGHHELAYDFDASDDSSWMAQHFFSGGQMPSKTLFNYFQNDLVIQKLWTVNGSHYQRTCREWLNNMDANRLEIMLIFQSVYGSEARKFWIYWRLFFVACEELFGFNDGEEWQVYHYLFQKRTKY